MKAELRQPKCQLGGWDSCCNVEEMQQAGPSDWLLMGSEGGGSGLDRLPGSWGRKAGDGALAKRNNMGVDWEHNEVC